MVNWWWIPPAAVGFLGVMLVLNGLVSLLGGRWLSGPVKLIAGAAMAWGALGLALLGLNVQSYTRLGHETPVATLSFKQVGPQAFEATLTQPGRDGMIDDVRTWPINGDDWRIEARVLRWKPWAKILGLDTQYRLERLAGRYEDIKQERHAVRSGHDISGGEPGAEILGYVVPWKPTIWSTAQRLRPHFDAVDTGYESAADMPMVDGGRYDVLITPSGLVARPTSTQAVTISGGGPSRR